MYSPVKECYCGCPECSAAGSYANVHCWAQSLVIRVLKDLVLWFSFFFFFFPVLAGWILYNQQGPCSLPAYGWSCMNSPSWNSTYFIILKLSRWWLPALLITTYPLINLPHSVSFAFVLPLQPFFSSHFFSFSPPICHFSLLPPIPQGACLFYVS